MNKYINKNFNLASVITWWRPHRCDRRINCNFLQDSKNKRIIRSYRTSSKSHLQLSTYLEEVIIGTILGLAQIQLKRLLA